MNIKELRKTAPGVFARRVNIRGEDGYALQDHRGRPCDENGVLDADRKKQKEAEEAEKLSEQKPE